MIATLKRSRLTAACFVKGNEFRLSYADDLRDIPSLYADGFHLAALLGCLGDDLCLEPVPSEHKTSDAVLRHAFLEFAHVAATLL